MKFENVFSPLKVRHVVLKNRVVLAPSGTCLASPEGYVTRELVEYYKRLARGGVGLITVADSPVDFEYAKTHEHQLNLGTDKVIGGLSILVENIERYGAKASIEVNHGGRLSPPNVIGKSPIAPSPLPPESELMRFKLLGKKIDYSIVEMTQDHINAVIERFADACFRCMQAGFEMVMIHGAHGHLISQFVSPYTNKRVDHYGGGLENRSRFVIELLDSIKARVNGSLVIQYRISAEELVPEGMRLKDTIDFIKMIEDRIDILHISAGLLSNPETIPIGFVPTYQPRGTHVKYAEKIREKVNLPISVVGNMDIELADKLIGEGVIDLVDMVRPLMADQEYVNKHYKGMLEEVRPCTRCNFCGQRVNQYLPIRCAVNPTLGRETEYPNIHAATVKKKVAVVGGGPAGMEFALTAASRGHEIVLFEKERELGGNLKFAAAPSFKNDMRKYLEWLTNTVAKDPKIRVKLSAEATPEIVKKENPDTVIVAVGSEPYIPEVEGIKKDNVFWAGEVLMGKANVGEKVVIAGAGLVGCETALHLSQQGKKVTIIDMLSQDEIAQDMPPTNRIALFNLLHRYKVEFKTEVYLERVMEGGVLLVDKHWKKLEIPAETVVLALGMKPRSETAEKFREVAPEVYTIGDCVKPGKLHDAIHQAFNIAVEL